MVAANQNQVDIVIKSIFDKRGVDQARKAVKQMDNISSSKRTPYNKDKDSFLAASASIEKYEQQFKSLGGAYEKNSMLQRQFGTDMKGTVKAIASGEIGFERWQQGMKDEKGYQVQKSMFAGMEDRMRSMEHGTMGMANTWKAAGNVATSNIGRIGLTLQVLSEKFQMAFLSSMFLGMAIQRVFSQIGGQGVTTFMDIARSSNIAAQGLAQLQAGFNVLKYTIGEAIANYLLPFLPAIMRIIDIMLDWIDKHEKLTAQIIIGGFALGAFLFVISQAVLGFAGLLGVVALLLKPFNFFWKILRGIAGVGIVKTGLEAGGVKTAAKIGGQKAVTGLESKVMTTTIKIAGETAYVEAAEGAGKGAFVKMSSWFIKLGELSKKGYDDIFGYIAKHFPKTTAVFNQNLTAIKSGFAQTGSYFGAVMTKMGAKGSAMFTKLGGSISKALGPKIMGMLANIMKMFGGWGKIIGAVTGKLFGLIVPIVNVLILLDILMDLFNLFDWLGGKINDATREGGVFAQTIRIIVNVFRILFNAIRYGWEFVWAGLKAGISWIWEKIEWIFDKLFGIADLGGKIAGWFKGAADATEKVAENLDASADAVARGESVSGATSSRGALIEAKQTGGYYAGEWYGDGPMPEEYLDKPAEVPVAPVMENPEAIDEAIYDNYDFNNPMEVPFDVSPSTTVTGTVYDTIVNDIVKTNSALGTSGNKSVVVPVLFDFGQGVGDNTISSTVDSTNTKENLKEVSIAVDDTVTDANASIAEIDDFVLNYSTDTQALNESINMSKNAYQNYEDYLNSSPFVMDENGQGGIMMPVSIPNADVAKTNITEIGTALETIDTATVQTGFQDLTPVIQTATTDAVIPMNEILAETINIIAGQGGMVSVLGLWMDTMDEFKTKTEEIFIKSLGDAEEALYDNASAASKAASAQIKYNQAVNGALD